MKFNSLLTCLLVTILLFSCSEKKEIRTILVKNPLDIQRSFETIELTKTFLKVDSLTNLGVKDVSTNKFLITQMVDFDGDGSMDVLLFQPEIPAASEKEFQIVAVSETERPKAEEYCYSRFVPERTDDYTWENNKVAFRMYGPVAQKMIEDSIPGGTLSSGVDAWLKRVDYPIINNWYKKELETDGSYHEDTGEGLDNFHVGISRGVGGVAIKKDSTYYVSKNYTEWKTITTGPIRTSFFLKIGDWDAAGNPITESKIISLDYGSNLSKFEISITGTEEISAGLTLHEKKGKVIANAEQNWLSHWEPHFDSELGTAIIAPGYFKGYETYDVPKKDLSNAYAHLKVKDNKVVYYAGFTWKKTGQFETPTAWEDYLTAYSEKLEKPLVVSLSK